MVFLQYQALMWLGNWYWWGNAVSNINGGGQGIQNMTNNGPTLADYNDAMRRRAAEQIGNGAF